jgi:hypothetical protein
VLQRTDGAGSSARALAARASGGRRPDLPAPASPKPTATGSGVRAAPSSSPAGQAGWEMRSRAPPCPSDAAPPSAPPALCALPGDLLPSPVSMSVVLLAGGTPLAADVAAAVDDAEDEEETSPPAPSLPPPPSTAASKPLPLSAAALAAVTLASRRSEPAIGG